jgi:hypothetical protein
MITRAGERLICAGAVIGAWALALPAHAQEQNGAPPQRPTIMFNRWQEDWSVLADPLTPREPFDELKYIPLSTTDPKVYLSLGGGLRERFEANDTAGFGVGANRNADYLISRLEVHADLRLGPAIQVFTQLESTFAPGKLNLTPVDQDRLDLEQAFVALSEPLGDGHFKLRVGRQQIAFDLQRFVGVRDGPNIRQSYDAIWGDYERGPWRLLGFYSLPVQYRDLRAFDSYSSEHLTYGGVRLERRFGSVETSISYSHYTQDNARFASVRGNERRDILDVHGSGVARGFDWDAEFMGQTGRIGSDEIQAWAVGSVSGYTFSSAAWSPRLGLQIDAASGDSNPNNHRLGTFNPLFPNGYYVTLAGYTGYVNFIHVKPSVTLHPTKALKLMVAGAAQWRETTADAVYTQPNIPVAGTAGRGSRWTGSYGQVRADYAFNSHLSGAIEAVHFSIGEAIRQAGGHDSNYCGVELKFGW